MTKPSDKVAVIVLGMHRSGTSSLAGLLDRFGCQGPATPIPGNETNTKGHFESVPVCDLNDEILKAMHSDWSEWRTLRPEWHCSPRFSEFRSRARQVLKEEFKDASLIYLKDPRLCLLLPFWLQVLTDEGYRSVVVHTHRNPLDVAASLKKRDGIELSIALLVWLRHVVEAERQSRGVSRCFTSYDKLLQDPIGIANDIEKSLGVPWPVRTPENLDWVDPNLRHHDHGSETVLASRTVPNLIRKIFETLEAWSTEGEAATDQERLNEIAQEFDKASLLFGPPMRTLEEQAALARAAQEGISRKLNEATDKLIEQEQALAQARNQALSGKARVAALEEELQGVRNEYLSSTSWQISAPIRLAGRLVHRLRRR